MNSVEQLGTQTLLNSIAGTAYITSFDLTILAIGTERWRRFAEENGAGELADPATVLNRNLFEFIEGNDTRKFYAKVVQALEETPSDTVRVAYRCDGPALIRKMWLLMTRISPAKASAVFLFQNLLLEAEPRSPVSLLENQLDRAGGRKGPVLAICSYCKNVRLPAGSRVDQWVSIEQYYELGGTDQVRLSHGICPACHEALNQAAG